jgi:hypothetical protein
VGAHTHHANPANSTQKKEKKDFFEDDCLLGYHTVQSHRSNDISEVLTASIIRIMTHKIGKFLPCCFI